MKKIVLIIVAVAVGFALGAYVFDKPQIKVGTVAPAQTFSTSRVASKGLNPATTTPFSILNNTGFDWGIKNIRIIGEATKDSYYSSTTISSLYFRCNTSTDAYLLNESGYYTHYGEFNTSTGEQFISTTTPTTFDTGVDADVANKWTIPAGTYFNCRLFGVDANGATMSMNATTSATSTGVIEIEYLNK
jgi:hypothetical protein